MFDLSKIFDLSKKFALPDTLLKSKNYCTLNLTTKFFQPLNCMNIQPNFNSFSGTSCPLSWTVFSAYAALLQQSQGIRAAWDSCLK